MKSFAVEPGLELYLFKNKVEINVTGHIEEKVSELGATEDHNTILQVQAGITYYF